MVGVGTHCSDGGSVLPKELGAYLFMDALKIGWALEPRDSLRYLVNSNYYILLLTYFCFIAF